MTADAAGLSGLTLRVDGQSLAPDREEDGTFTFRLRLPAQEIRLVSGAARPVDLGHGTSDRWQGVFVRGLEFRQGAQTSPVPFDHILLTEGFYNIEQDGRWTNGDAAVPEALVPQWEGDAELIVQIDGRARRMSFSTNAPPPLHPVFSAFESCGENCQFAQVQDYFDSRIAPGLLSWALIEHDALLEGLDNDFEGVDDPESSELSWEPRVGGITGYILRTYYFRAHTGRKDKYDPSELDDMLEMYCGRMRLLRRKLLRDLAAPKRIMVHVSRRGAIDKGRILDLHAALRRHGPVSLLWVAAGAARPNLPNLETLGDGLYLARFGKLTGAEGPFDDWLELCTEVLELERQRQSATV